MGKNENRFGLKALAVALSLALAGAGSASYAAGGPVGVRLEFSAGLGLLLNGGGDLQTFGSSSVAFASQFGREAFQISTFDWKNPSSSFTDWRAEVILTYGRYFGLGFGIGHASLSGGGDYALTFDYYASRYTAFQIDRDWAFHHRFEVSMVPLQLNFYGFLPLERLTLYAFAGPGIYLGSLTHDYENRSFYRHDEYYWPPENPVFAHYAHEIQSQESRAEKATCNRFGFQGGLGVELRVTPQLSFGLESYLRTVSFNDWQGSFTSSFSQTERLYDNTSGWRDGESSSGSAVGQGTLWIYEIGPYANYLNEQPEMFLLETEPVGRDYANARKAAINFNAAGFLMTVSYRF